VGSPPVPGRSSDKRLWAISAIRANTRQDALVGDASAYMLEYAYFGRANPETDYDAKVFGQADRSIALARDNAFAYQVKCYYYLIVSRRPEEVLRAAEAALAINPNFPSAHMARANAESYLRKFEQAKSDVQQAMRLRACPHLSQASAHTSCNPAEKLRAVFS
jgi:tetratricopeptide (TPR) repeat protein